MIKPTDTLLLATTKLRTRQLRTIVTVGISGLLFAVLVGVMTMYQGALKSIDSFNKNGLNSRYLVSATPDSPFLKSIFTSPALVANAQAIYNQTIVSKKAEAKRLGLTYDPTTEPKPTLQLSSTQSGPAFLNLAAPSSQQAIQAYLTTHPIPGISDLQKVSSAYHPTGLYNSATAQPNDGILSVMKDGLEKFPSAADAMEQRADNIFEQNMFSIMSSRLTQPFLLKKTTWSPKSDAIPLVVPYSVATKLLNLPALPAGASADLKLARLKQLYNTAGTVTVAACYRNNASASQIQTAISTAEQIAQNTNNKDYTKPSLIYGLPAANSCGPAVVTRDVRTKDEVKTAAKQAIFDAEFSTTLTTPDQQKLTFQIVGLEPDQQNVPSNSAAGILQSLVSSSLANTIAIPDDMYKSLPSVQRYDALLDSQQPNTNFTFNPNTYYVEFANATDARHFITGKSCTARSDGTCATGAKPFQLSAFGSNSIALQDLQHKFNSFFEIAALVVVGVAAVIMTGTVGRMLADSRRETAVFRAIGANRFDISFVYGTYTILLSCMIALASILFGLVLAKIGDDHFWKQTTLQAKLAFGGADTTQTFHLFRYTIQVWWVAAIAIGAGVLGMILPLLRNVRRNPIKDMREE